jgi:hypothetical protein
MGWIPFAAEKNTITSDRALADCFDRKITLERDMVSVPPLVSTITDSHFTGARSPGQAPHLHGPDDHRRVDR